MEFLSWIENSAFSVWVRESPSLFAYAGILFLHTVGLAIVVGISAMIDLRLLGVASDLPIAPLERFFPIIWAGFWINAVSGSMLLAQDATTTFTNPIFGIKMVLIALAVADMLLLRRVVFRGQVEQEVSRQGKLLAVASLVLWFGATTAGRLMTYLATVSGVPGSEHRIGS
jgi:hypothetical protein